MVRISNYGGNVWRSRRVGYVRNEERKEGERISLLSARDPLWSRVSIEVCRAKPHRMMS